MLNEERNHIVPTFEEVMADSIIQCELKMLYNTLVLEVTGNNGHYIDDWECIIADRMFSLIMGRKMDMMKYARLPFGLERKLSDDDFTAMSVDKPKCRNCEATTNLHQNRFDKKHDCGACLQELQDMNDFDSQHTF